MDDLAMTCSDFVNALKMIYVLKNTLFLEVTMAMLKTVVIDRRATT